MHDVELYVPLSSQSIGMVEDLSAHLLPPSSDWIDGGQNPTRARIRPWLNEPYGSGTFSYQMHSEGTKQDPAGLPLES